MMQLNSGAIYQHYRKSSHHAISVLLYYWFARLWFICALHLLLIFLEHLIWLWAIYVQWPSVAWILIWIGSKRWWWPECKCSWRIKHNWQAYVQELSE